MQKNGWYFLFLLILLQACSVDGSKVDATKLAVRSIVPEYAEGFVIDKLPDSSYRITLLDLEHLPDTLQQIHWKPQDLKSLACFSTTHIPFLKALGKLSLLKGSGFTELIVDEQVRQMIDRGEVVNLTVGHDLDDEKLYGIEPELMFVYPYGGEQYLKYLESGIGCVQISEYLEKTPLGRAEWIKVFGVLLNCENEANQIFQTIEASYLEKKQSVQANAAKPTVFTGSYDGGNWFMPPGNSFAAQLIADAGGRYIYADSVSGKNLVLPFEKMLVDAVNCDFWGKIIYEKGPLTAEKLTEGDQRLREFRAFQTKQVFYCNAAESDYHGQAVLEPHVMLADLIAIFYPDPANPHKPVYFQPWKGGE
jgi:iron complex transport system substrate-binding protein